MTQLNSIRPTASETLISVVLPVYNEAQVLDRLYGALIESLNQCESQFEIVFVNDGSDDDSATVLDRIAHQDKRVRVLHLSRNFGHQAAVQAGIAHADGDAVILMDSDMQDDPSALKHFVDQWRAGYDVVYAVRFNRKENRLKRLLFFSFYRLLNFVSDTPIPKDAGNFGLVDRRVLRCMLAMKECDRFFPGLRRWVGFRQIGVPIERGARHDDQPRVSFVQLIGLAKSAIFSFSRLPLSMFYAIAAVSVVICLACTGFTLYHKLLTNLAVPGWTSITIVASLFGALNSLGIGILGEYVVRIYDQVRERPQFIVDRSVNIESRVEPVEDLVLRSINEVAATANDATLSQDFTLNSMDDVEFGFYSISTDHPTSD